MGLNLQKQFVTTNRQVFWNYMLLLVGRAYTAGWVKDDEYTGFLELVHKVIPPGSGVLAYKEPAEWEWSLTAFKLGLLFRKPIFDE